MLIVPRPMWVPTGATLVYTGETVDTSGQTTYTFTTQPFSTAAANRSIIVAYATSVLGRTVSSATIGGVAATKVNEVLSTDAATTAGFLIAAVPTGTTGTIAITLNTTNSRMGIGIYAAYGLISATPTDTDNDTTLTTQALSMSALTIPSGGFGLAHAYAAAGTTSWAWTNMTEDFDHDVGGTRIQSGAHSSNAGTPTITAQGGAGTPSGGHVMVGAAWH